eukprot:5918853-Amphidinium_carterae.1
MEFWTLQLHRDFCRKSNLDVSVCEEYLDTLAVFRQVPFPHHCTLQLCCSAATYFRAQFQSICSMAGIPCQNGLEPSSQCPNSDQQTDKVDFKGCIQHAKSLVLPGFLGMHCEVGWVCVRGCHEQLFLFCSPQENPQYVIP